RWFKKRSGLALGIMTAIGGLFGVFTQPIVGYLINNLGWRLAYHVVGIAIIVLVVPTILFLLRESPKEKGLQPYGVGDEKEETKENVNQGGIAFSTAKKSPAFILLALFFFIVTAVSSFSIHIPTYLVDQGHDVTFAGNMMAAMMVGVFIGSLLFGYLSDKIGAKRTSLLAMSLGLISMILLVGLTEFVPAIIISLTLFGFMTASIGTIAPAMTSALFGSRDYSQIYSTASMGLAVASIIALPAYGYIFDFTGSYTSALYIIMALFVANIIFTIMAFRNRDKMIAEGLWE
ncbi:MAG TPA: MFS transporter, partial [Pseudogracilibacillus sp.]|nr:MFS transporter [Pseudogracilibacillus sp.]